MENFIAEYDRIKELNNPHLVADELHKKSDEFRDAYHKARKKERNKKAYDAKKEAFNEERRTKYKEEKKNEVKPIIRQMPKIDVATVDISIKRSNTDSKKIKELTENSIKTYINTIKKTYAIYNKTGDINESEIMKYLHGIKHNPTKLYNENKYILINISDIAQHHSYLIPHLYKIFSRFNTKRLKEFREKLFPYFTAYGENYVANRNNLILNEEEIAKISFNKEDVLVNAEKIEDINLKILYCLMFMIPTRRIGDYRLTKITKNEEDTKITDYNWYYNKKIYINNTKNKQKIILDIPDELDAIIKTKTSDSPYLIGNMKQSTASNNFKELTKNIYGSPFSAIDIRKIYATYNLKMGAEFRDITKMLKNQLEMGHSLPEHLNYILPNTSSN